MGGTSVISKARLLLSVVTAAVLVGCGGGGDDDDGGGGGGGGDGGSGVNETFLVCGSNEVWIIDGSHNGMAFYSNGSGVTLETCDLNPSYNKWTYETAEWNWSLNGNQLTISNSVVTIERLSNNQFRAFDNTFNGTFTKRTGITIVDEDICD